MTTRGVIQTASTRLLGFWDIRGGVIFKEISITEFRVHSNEHNDGKHHQCKDHPTAKFPRSPWLSWLLYRTHMANSALKCQIIILIIARSFYSYNNILNP